MRNNDYYFPAVALGIAFTAKLPGLFRGWRDPLVRSVCFLVFAAAICFFFAAPPTIRAVNRITGIPNFSAPLVYCVMCAFSCACLVLIVNWRGGPPETIRRSSRRWLSFYAVAIIALATFFALGDAPVERLRDLDTHYATTPFIREMIVTYLCAHMVAAVVTTTLCLRWAQAVHGWLRVGLIVLVVGFVLNLLFGAAKLTAVFARWSGKDWDTLSTDLAPPVAATGGLIVTVGFLLPLIGPKVSGFLHAWIMYLRLGTLWRQLKSTPGDHTALRGIPWWSAPDMARETAIHDELLRLQSYFDEDVRLAALEAMRDKTSAESAEIVSLAAMVAAAVDAKSTMPDLDTHEETSPGARALAAARVESPDLLVKLSRALRSPFVAAARKEAAPTGSSPR
ncbi:MAB_1171c family putative transporter [Streptomyces sp. NPDC002889]|uniref:MAB_1171c family putative transporter n=1 Tax=Streptomyces sp. NPDC002889 TaxID=3364669 RepID=UPI0036B35FE9